MLKMQKIQTTFENQSLTVTVYWNKFSLFSAVCRFFFPNSPHQRGHIISPARGGPAPHCSAGMGVGVGAVDGPQGAAAWETGWETGGGASGRDLGGGDPGAPPGRAPALGGVAGCRVGSPEAERGDGSSHPGGPATGRGGSAGGGGGDGGRWGGGGDGGGGGCCCCCCSGGGCCGRGGGGGGSDGLSGHAGVSLEG